MAVPVQMRVITQEDLLALDAQDKWVEVVDGEIVEDENNVTFLHLIIIQNLYDLLKPFVTANKLGRVFADGARYILTGTRQNIRRARKPDVSFLRAERIPADFDWSGDFEGVPDLAVEVAFPGQTNMLLTHKVADYLGAGTEEAWIIYPQRGEIYQYRRDADMPHVYKSGEIIETPLFPGLQILVDALFNTEAV